MNQKKLVEQRLLFTVDENGVEFFDAVKRDTGPRKLGRRWRRRTKGVGGRLVFSCPRRPSLRQLGPEARKPRIWYLVGFLARTFSTMGKFYDARAKKKKKKTCFGWGKKHRVTNNEYAPFAVSEFAKIFGAGALFVHAPLFRFCPLRCW